jgi:hypothetical protein
MISRNLALAAFVLAGFAGALAQHEMPPGMTHEQHQAQMQKEAELKKRGNAAMGFDQEKTTHHFFLIGDGGVIQVESNAAADVTSRDQIRAHLKAISEQFTRGDFRAPLATHNETPPGVAVMQRLKSAIRYSYEEKPGGAAVRITSANPEALKAVHEFLRYQIKEHVTGDPLAVAAAHDHGESPK